MSWGNIWAPISSDDPGLIYVWWEDVGGVGA